MTAKPIAITQGDPAGIGPEIIAKAFRDAPDVTRGCFVAGDVATLRRASALISSAGSLPLPVALLDSAADAWNLPPRCIGVLQVLPEAPLVALGLISAQAGRAAASSVEWAARAALSGEIAALVRSRIRV